MPEVGPNPDQLTVFLSMRETCKMAHNCCWPYWLHMLTTMQYVLHCSEHLQLVFGATVFLLLMHVQASGLSLEGLLLSASASNVGCH